ncbi:hypothetical protein ACWGS9_19890 [Bradyrhizobium sp. Arg314]
MERFRAAAVFADAAADQRARHHPLSRAAENLLPAARDLFSVANEMGLLQMTTDTKSENTADPTFGFCFNQASFYAGSPEGAMTAFAFPPTPIELEIMKNSGDLPKPGGVGPGDHHPRKTP